MTFAGLIFNGVFSLLNLLLLLVVAHRLRQVAAALPPSRPRPWLAPGTQVPDFEAATIDGETVTLSQLRGKQSLVAFFSVGCEPCREQVPLFAMFVTGAQAPEAAVAVIVGGPDSHGFTKQLTGKAVVVNESQGGPLGQAFRATAFPALYLLDEAGIVTASGPGMGAILSGSNDLTPVPR